MPPASGKASWIVLQAARHVRGYSVYNHQRGMHDQRSHLFREYLRIVEGLMPRWLVMENVTGIMSAGEGEAFQAVLAGIRALGYTVEAKILRAEEYGVPQERRRVVFIGNSIGAPITWPVKTHGEGLAPFTTIKDALSDLPVLANGEDRNVTKYRTRPISDFQREMRKGSRSVPQPFGVEAGGDQYRTDAPYSTRRQAGVTFRMTSFRQG